MLAVQKPNEPIHKNRKMNESGRYADEMWRKLLIQIFYIISSNITRSSDMAETPRVLGDFNELCHTIKTIKSLFEPHLGDLGVTYALRL